MPKIDFAKIDDVSDFSPIPEGEYLCRLVDIEESTTQQGDEMWKLKFVIEDGEFASRYIFDNMVFSPKALSRAKLICGRLGVNVDSEMDLQPDHLIDKKCLISLTLEDWEDEEGKTKKRNQVPFAGYDFADGSTGEDGSEDNVPF